MERLNPVGRIVPKPSSAIGMSRLGIGFEKLDRNVFNPSRAYDLVAGTGVHYVRIQSGWQRTEKVKGVYDFAWLDEIVDNLIARGMEPWICLCYGNEIYSEAGKQYFGSVGIAPVFSEEEKNAWYAYSVAVARRYRGRVRWYEVWNEPDGLWCWKHGVNAAEYAVFANATCDAVHEGDPEAKAIAGVLCNINLPYFRIMFDNGVCDHADAVSFHRYNADELAALSEIRSLRALIDRYNPAVGIIQGESGTQSDSRGAGALRGGSWTQEKQMKYLLRHRLLDLSSEVIFTSHFTAVDMIEALNGKVGDKASWLDYGYFGVISAEFDENGFATGSYQPKQSYRALQHLCTVFTDDVLPADLPLRRVVLDSPRVFGKDESSSRFVSLGFRRKNGAEALAYWKAADLMRETYEGTVSFQLAGEDRPIHIVDLAEGTVYAVPESMIERSEGAAVTLKNLPLTDVPLLLTFGDFC